MGRISEAVGCHEANAGHCIDATLLAREQMVRNGAPQGPGGFYAGGGPMVTMP